MLLVLLQKRNVKKKDIKEYFLEDYRHVHNVFYNIFYDYVTIENNTKVMMDASVHF